ncbi:MAG TPA: cytochrome c oxidase subunit I [Candidatus Aquilonibacter sp.]|nr:cytochrome c oxidase subunit I [Candidatus Aquilonibacter sp.]
MKDITITDAGEMSFEEEAREGWLSWVASVDHKRIGILYLWSATIFFVIGGILALLMRVQLAVPENHFLTPELYNQLFTMHGTTMIFLVVMPALIGFSNYLVPLMIGARDVAFPRLNALGFWAQAFGGMMLYFSFATEGLNLGGAPAVGWFSYAPLSEMAYSYGSGETYWVLALLGIGVGTLSAGINLMVTIICLRAPGMTMWRLPLFVWMVLVTGFLIVNAIPPLNAGLVMLLFDRILNAHFFRPATGGSALLWQHVFWIFGHPEVYIMVLPAFGIISEVIPVFSGKPIFGYEFVAASGIAIGFLSLLVWAHHMFAVGLGHTVDLFFAVTSFTIAVPTGVKIFNWTATMYGGRLRFTTSMMFAVAFLLTFTIGGLSGVAFAAVPIDWQLTDSYFVVAHFHYVLFGGSAFAAFAGVYYWFPKITGRMLSEHLGKWNFWLTFIGFNLTFMVQHVLGMYGMPRRVWTYPPLPGWEAMNMISTVGAFVLAFSVLIFLVNIMLSLRGGEISGDNPWDAWSLEWATTSPPAIENFPHGVPPVRGRRPLWDLAHPDRPDEEPGSRDDREHLKLDRNKLGVGLFIFSEFGFFGALIGTYIYFYLFPSAGPSAAKSLDVARTFGFSICLFLSSATFHMAARSFKIRDDRKVKIWLGLTLLLGAAFIFGQIWEYTELLTSGVTLSSNLFGSTFFTLTGFHGLHVLMGLVVLAILLGLALGGRLDDIKPSGFEAAGMYWHFVDAVWVVIFSIVYLWPLFG